MGHDHTPITLTPEQEAYLQRAEYTQPKPRPRLRTQVLRRAARSNPPDQIAQYVPLHPDTIKWLLARCHKEGLAVLPDRSHLGRPPVLPPEMRATLTDCLRQAGCAWHCARLVARLQQQYGVVVSAEAVRQWLRCAGFVWRRARYVPARCPQAYADAQDDLRFLKRGLCTACRSDGLWARRGVA